MGEKITWEDLGVPPLEAVAPSSVAPATGPRKITFEDMGVPDVIKTPEQAGYFPEELESAKRMMLRKRGDTRSWGQTAKDTLANVGDAISAVTPTALGGKGSLGLSDIVSGAVNAGKEAVMAPGKMAYGDVPMFDDQGMPTEEGISEGLKFTSVGTLGGPLGRGFGLAGPRFTENSARRKVAEAIDADIGQGHSRGYRPGPSSAYGPRVLPGAAVDQLAMLSDEGVPVSGYDLSGGPNIKKLVETSSEKAHDTSHVRDIQQMIAGRAANSGTYIANTVDNIAGRILVTGDEFRAAVDAIPATNNPNYTAVMGMPEHQQIFSPTLKTILEQRPVFQSVLKERAEGMKNSGKTSPPIYNRRGQLDIQPFNAPPLEYLDDVYKTVRDRATKAFEDGNSTVANDLKSAANALRAELDKLSAAMPDGTPAYRMIRDEASEVFGAKNALEAGYKYIQSADPLKLNQITTAYRKYSPDQREQFRVGLLSRIKDDALKPTGSRKVTSYLDGSNPTAYEKIEAILGPDDTMRLSNQVSLQKVVNESAAPRLSPQAEAKVGSRLPGPLGVGIGAGALLAGQQVIANIPQIAAIAMNPITQGAAVAAGVAASTFGLKKILGLAKNAYEARVSQAVLDVLETNDPAAMAALERFSPKTVKLVIDRVNRGMQRAAPSIAGEAGDQEYVIEDAMGNRYDAKGRAARKSGGRIKGNPISAEVKRVRTLLSHKTASMLSMPDDAVATALHLAKGQN